MTYGPCDPSWQDFSASLRGGILYVKMPTRKAQQLVVDLDVGIFFTGDLTESNPADGLLAFLREQLGAAKNASVFYGVSVAEASRDAENLLPIEPQAPSEKKPPCHRTTGR